MGDQNQSSGYDSKAGPTSPVTTNPGSMYSLSLLNAEREQRERARQERQRDVERENAAMMANYPRPAFGGMSSRPGQGSGQGQSQGQGQQGQGQRHPPPPGAPYFGSLPAGLNDPNPKRTTPKPSTSTSTTPNLPNAATLAGSSASAASPPARPTLPPPSYLGLGSGRSLPSPFTEKAPGGQGALSPTKTHSIPTSAASSGPGTGSYGYPAHSPKLSASGSGSASTVVRPPQSSLPGTSPKAPTSAPVPASAASSSGPGSASGNPPSATASKPYGYGYAAYGGYGHGGFGSFVGMPGSSGYGGPGYNFAQRDRERDRERERERERERDREWKESEHARREQQRERERRQLAGTKQPYPSSIPNASSSAQSAGGSIRPPGYADPYASRVSANSANQDPLHQHQHRRTSSSSQRPSVTNSPPSQEPRYVRHIEVLNKPAPAPPSGSAYSASAVKGEGMSVLQQVVGAREPRPYGFKQEDAVHPLAQQQQQQQRHPQSAQPLPMHRNNRYPSPPARESKQQQQQQSSQSRPRMDAAVEESNHRRIQTQQQQSLMPAAYRPLSQQQQSSNSQHKRKRADQPETDAEWQHRQQQLQHAAPSRKRPSKSNVQPQPQPDWAAITSAPKREPEVTSQPVEAFLRSTAAGVNRVVGKEMYLGPEWRVGQTFAGVEGATSCLGGVLLVTIHKGFLGRGWLLRGEKGWDQALPVLPADHHLAQLNPESRPPFGFATTVKERQAWGTDVYTDDSDLGAVLVHAGWIRWVVPPPVGASGVDSRDHERQNAQAQADSITVTVRIIPRLIRYIGTTRNGFKSRSWGNGHDGVSIVVERVDRVKKSKANNGRWAAKRLMNEVAEERKRVLGLSIVQDTTNTLIFTREGKSAFRYSRKALRGWLATKSDLGDVDEEDQPRHTMFSSDLCFGTGADRYRLEMKSEATAPEPRFTLYHQKTISARSKTDTTMEDTIGSDLARSDLEWTDEGLLAQTTHDEGEAQGGKGFLCDAELFWWVSRASEKEQDVEEGKVEAMDTDS